MNYWLQALKQWNAGKKYTIPRKGTAGYQQVKAIEKQLCVSSCTKGAGAYSHQIKQFRRRLGIIERSLPTTFIGDDENTVLGNIQDISHDISQRIMGHKSGGPDKQIVPYFQELSRYITSENFSNSQELLTSYSTLFQDILTAQQEQYAEARGISRKNLFN
jgi:hypothetical protein